ncbi:hypothetical protein [Acinetobacter sp.]
MYSTAHLHECDRVYWSTHENKSTAQQVYDQMAQKKPIYVISNA